LAVRLLPHRLEQVVSAHQTALRKHFARQPARAHEGLDRGGEVGRIEQAAAGQDFAEHLFGRTIHGVGRHDRAAVERHGYQIGLALHRQQPALAQRGDPPQRR
jgi:hypothetical protein